MSISLEIKEIKYEPFGNCVKITNGIIAVVVTIDFGPRIIHFGFCDEDNLLYSNVHSLHVASSEDTEGGKIFSCSGGHRLWLNLERADSTVTPDNTPVFYTILPGGVRFNRPKDETASVESGFEIMMGDDAADFMILHTAKNCSKETKVCGLMPITMLAKSGLVVLPQNTDATDMRHPNRALAYWPGTDFRDERITYGNRFVSLRWQSGNEKPLHIGCNNVLGWMALIGEKYTFMKRYIHSPQIVYPDFGSSCEVNLRKDAVELTTLSPMYRIEPGQGIKHVENLSIFRTCNSVNPNDEEGIVKYIENLK